MLRFLLALSLLGATLVPVTSHAETYSTCHAFLTTLPATISSQGVYCLKQDLSTAMSTGNAISVNTNNVTIDCNGYKIGGLAAGVDTLATGIHAQDRVNVRVRNCNIRGFYSGVYLTGSGHAVEDNIFDSNRDESIVVSSDGGLIRNNQITATGGGGTAYVIGIHVYGDVDIRDNRIDGVAGRSGSDATTIGILLTSGSSDTVSHNIVRNLVPTGGGFAYGVSVASTKTAVDDNRVTLSSPSVSLGYYCSSNAVALRNNTSWGFANGIDSGCIDAGGNAVH